MKSSPNVKAVSIIALILGAFGLFSALSTMVTLAVGTEKIQAMVPVPPQTAQAAQAQAEMARAIAALTAEWKTYNTAMTVLLLFVASGLLAGGILSLKLREQGRRILATGFVAAIPLEILRGVASVSIALGTADIIREWTAKLIQASTAPGAKMPPEFDGIMSGVMGASAMAGLVFAIGWVVLQIGFYLFGALYLRKPDVKALFHAS